MPCQNRLGLLGGSWGITFRVSLKGKPRENLLK